jgi:hypothetical protein
VATPAYVFKRTPQFRKSFDGLDPAQQKAAKEAFKIFKANPFDPRLRTHKINRLTSLLKHTVHSVTIDGDLRAVFTIRKNEVISLDIGTHAIYK